MDWTQRRRTRITYTVRMETILYTQEGLDEGMCSGTRALTCVAHVVRVVWLGSDSSGRRVTLRVCRRPSRKVGPSFRE